VRYEGLYPSQIRERFEQDAADAANDDWYPASESWQGGVLFVVFEHDPGRRHRTPPPAAASSPTPSARGDLGPLRAPLPQWRRAGLAVLVGVGLIVVALVTFLGFGDWDRPGTAPGDPVHLSTPAPGGLGPRADAIAFLEGAGFRGAVSPAGDGRERWLGVGAAGSIAELLGPAAGLERATITVFPVQDVGVGEIAQPTEVLRFLDTFAPGSTDWATAHTDDAIASRGVPLRQRFGDRLVLLSALDGTDSSVYTYAVTQAEAPARSRRTPRPVRRVRTFGEGTWQVGTEVKPGTYRATADGSCTWARLGEPVASLEPTLGSAVGSGPRLATIGRRDVAFRSIGCGRWPSDLSRVTQDRSAFGDGSYLVGDDVAAGGYVSSGNGSCSWARLSGFGGSPEEVIDSGLATGPQEVTIHASDTGFTSSGCGGWTRR
jgi:hypothetical protein